MPMIWFCLFVCFTKMADFEQYQETFYESEKMYIFLKQKTKKSTPPEFKKHTQ